MTITWFRRDLRLEDNAAWAHACEKDHQMIPVFIWNDSDNESDGLGDPSKWWLHHAINDLDANLGKMGLTLVRMKGNPADCLQRLLDSNDVHEVVWNRCHEPSLVHEELQVEDQLRKNGVSSWVGQSNLLVEPDSLLNKQGTPYKVFSAFYKEWQRRIKPGSRISNNSRKFTDVAGSYSEDLNLLHGTEGKKFKEWYDPTRKGALYQLKMFLNEHLEDYAINRDIPSIDGSSRLSSALHWGQIGPQEILSTLSNYPESEGKRKFISELAWREFSNYILFHYPHTAHQPFRQEFRGFPWEQDEEVLDAWKNGMTGYPIVEAAMRQLMETGWINNRVRMLVASFLVKHLLQDWKVGASWFMKKLIDADLANNQLGWQWVAGCGVDAAPFFRVFNPVTQGKKFDSKGQYIRSHLPELENVPDKYLHEPWLMPDQLQEDYGCLMGRDYPEPICSLVDGRIRAMNAWKSLK